MADHNGTSLSGPDVFGDEEDSVSENAGPDVQHHFVAAELGLVKNLPGAWIRGHVGIGQAADHFVPDIVAQGLRSARPERRAVLPGLTNQGLRVVDKLVELAMPADGEIGVGESDRTRRLGRESPEAEQRRWPLAAFDQMNRTDVGTFDFLTHGFARRLDDGAHGSRAFAFGSAGRRTGYLRKPHHLDDQTPRRNHAREFRVAEVAQQTPDVPVDGLGGESFPRPEVSADQSCADASIETG